MTRTDSARSTNAGGRETKELLMQTAERMFAERGIDAVSLREVCLAAGMRMSHAVAYHFGDKNGLVDAILERNISESEARRESAILDALKQEDLTLRLIVEAFIRPMTDDIRPDSYKFRFMAQVSRQPQAVPLAMLNNFNPATLQLMQRQDERLLKHIPPELRSRRRRLAASLAINALADVETEGLSGRTREVVISDLIDSIVALQSNPPSESTNTALHGLPVLDATLAAFFTPVFGRV